MERVTEASGVGVFRDGNTFIVADVRTRGLYVVAFVATVVGLILVVNGAVMLGLLRSEVPLLIGLGLVGLGGLSLAGAFLAVRSIRSRRSDVAGSDLLVIVDPASNQLLNAAGEPICALADVKQRTLFQATSSARRLILLTPTGEIPIVRGNGLAGGLGRLPKVFADLGIEPVT